LDRVHIRICQHAGTLRRMPPGGFLTVGRNKESQTIGAHGTRDGGNAADPIV
jgi:hypothetical protein